jgi:hypothetical protein
MAAITMNTAAIRNGVSYLESVSAFTAATTTAVTKGVSVPPWAVKAVFTIFYDTSSSTTPTFDFVLGIPDWGSELLTASPTDATDVASVGNAAWNGITTVTGSGPYQITVEVGPDCTDDDTGSATASCWYSVKAELPPVLTYTYTLDGTSGTETYTFRIAVQWKR